MTTNQTIDGVPRELMENFASYAEGSASAEVQLWVKKLRAMLDAPAQLSGDPAGSFDKHMQYMHENIELKKRIAKLEAAQPQGEPVAIHSGALKLLKRVHTNLVAYKGSAVELNLKTPISDAILLDVEEFIAAQPTPVAQKYDDTL